MKDAPIVDEINNINNILLKLRKKRMTFTVSHNEAQFTGSTKYEKNTVYQLEIIIVN